MVWSYGEDKLPSETIFPVRSVMTAPFTSDPDAIQPRRLRSQLDSAQSIGVLPFQVGCGFAAHGGMGGADVLVVRISDGWSWVLPRVADEFRPDLVLGVTCDEVFIEGRVAGRSLISRVRIDSLGPGEPPD